jgi:hypothetical protein
LVLEKEINLFQDEAILKRFMANETQISMVQGSISAIITASELEELQGGSASMYSRLASAELNISNFKLTFSDLTTKYDTVSGKVTDVTSRVSSLELSADGFTTRVSKLENGKTLVSYINQDAENASINASKINLTADSVKVAFNNIGKYIQIENARLNIYNGAVSDSNRRLRIDENGSHFWRDGYEVGYIGASQWVNDTSKRGLVLNLETDGAFLAFGRRDEKSDNVYTCKFTYVGKAVNGYNTANRLYVGADIDMMKWAIRNPAWVGYKGTGTTTGVTDWFKDAEGYYLWFRNGILVDCSNYKKY